MSSYTEQEVIEYLRNRIGYKYPQTKLAKELGISQSYLSEILSGKKQISLDVIRKLKLKVTYLGDL